MPAALISSSNSGRTRGGSSGAQCPNEAALGVGGLAL